MDDLLKIEAIIRQFAPHFVIYGLMGLGALCVLGYVYIAATPTEDDDHWLQKIEASPVMGLILRLLVKFSPVERKDKVG